MGEAKRRKKLDASFGKSYITIQKSEISDNWLIIINGKCFDNAIDYEDAKKVAQWAENELKKHPLPKQCSDEQFVKWFQKYGHSSPDVKAQVQQLNRQTGKIENVIVDFSELK